MPEHNLCAFLPPSVFARFLHIAVAKGLRALAYVLSARMAGFGSLDIKEHNGQVKNIQGFVIYGSFNGKRVLVSRHSYM